jgi:hypothetical protein
MQRSFWHVVLFQGVTPRAAPSLGTTDGLAVIREITRNPLAPVHDQVLEINGWAASTTGRTTEMVVRPDGSPAEMTFTVLPSLDIADYLKRSGRRFQFAETARFIITTPCVSGCHLVVFGGGKELGRLPLDVAGRNVMNEAVAIRTDALTVVRQDSKTGFLIDAKLAVLDSIRDIFAFFTPKLLPIALVAYVVGAVAIVRRRLSPMLLFSTALIAAVFANLSVVSYVDATSFQAVVTHYLCCAYVILPLAVMFALWDGGSILQGLLRSTLAPMQDLSASVPAAAPIDLALPTERRDD